MKVRLVIVLSLIACGTLNSTAQRFCKHLRMQEQMAQANTLDPRSDTFDVQSYEINASFLDYQSLKAIDATTVISVVLLQESTRMSLDLLDIPVSAVTVNGTAVSFAYNSPKLSLALPTLAVGDAFTVSVSYAGNPKSDAQWGGFYFTGEYAFNLGVGFAADPHNFGRAWFPCFDNFTDRALYYTNITVDSGKRAYANGLLTEIVDNGDQTQTFKWSMDDPIPTYLASVAIANYEEVTMNVDGIPVLLTSLAADTANLRKSFENIPTCIRRFEEVYGDHSFDRIGFNTVPFNSGAMEHATNIAYPRYAIAAGDKSSETLYAHELAHHWWGNTITCKTQEDMWLNEGWASYSERIFLEAVYGRERYDEDIEDNHRQVLQFAHVQDGEVLPVSGIGHANTYGRHVYNKGADMVHTLRGMMGDTAFFAACTSFQQEFKFKDVTTDDMRRHFQLFTPLGLNGFFYQWVEEAGFPHFDILYTREVDDKYEVRIKQSSRFNDINYNFVVAKVTAFSADWERHDAQVLIMNSQQSFTINCPFEPVYWSFDFDDLISDAVTTDWAVITDNTPVTMSQGMMKKITADVPTGDSILLRVEHHWAPADGTYGAPSGAVLSRQRYWTVDGIWNDDMSMSSEITYSGLITSSADFGYLDNELIRITEDSLVLLYRPNGTSAWSVHPDYTKNAGSLFDKRGTITIHSLKKGQYALAMYDATLASGEELTKPTYSFKLYPNPANNELNVEFATKHDCCTLEITNLQGQVVLTEKLKGKTKTKKIDVSSLTPGTYFVGVITDNLAYDIQKVVVE
jgi:aminopeptidase N